MQILQPYDQHNQEMESQVHPKDWSNPAPASEYNLLVIGAGPAGLVAAIGAAGLGAKVALVEKGLLGGDCLTVGCVPSKALIRSARVAAIARDAAQFGVHTKEVHVDFPAVMERMRRLRAHISHHDAASRLQGLGIDVFLGSGQFTASDTFEIDNASLKFKRAVVATGARAAELPIEGLSEAGFLTNESLFSLTELPQSMVIIGGGPIGSEMAQAFANFGTKVTIVERGAHILSREEPDAARIVQDNMTREGVQVLVHSEVDHVLMQDGKKQVVVRDANGMQTLPADQILASVGRAPNVEDLGLEKIGVDYDARKGIVVDDRLLTTNSRVFAAGDVASKYKFTHAADFMARIVIQNALFMGRSKASALTIPWTTYTSPELAHVGLTPAQAEEKGLAIDTYTQPMEDVDRALLDGETEGFVRIHTKQGKDDILGATIVAEHAGDLISEVTLAMTHGLGLGKIASTIHPYPTQADAIRKLGDQYNKTRLKPWLKNLLGWWLGS